MILIASSYIVFCLAVLIVNVGFAMFYLMAGIIAAALISIVMLTAWATGRRAP